MDMYPINKIQADYQAAIASNSQASEPFPQPSSLKENPQPCVELT